MGGITLRKIMALSKYGDRQFWKLFSQWYAQHALMMRLVFFSFGGGVGGRVICLFIFFVPNVFSTCSQHVPLRVPKFLSCSLRHSQWHLNLICPKFNTLVYKLKRSPIGGIYLHLFCNWGSKEVLPLGECAQFSKNFVDGLMNMALSKTQKKKRYEHTMN